MTLLPFYAKSLRQILSFLPFVRLFLFYVWYYTGGLCRICELVLAKSESFSKICGKKAAVQPVRIVPGRGSLRFLHSKHKNASTVNSIRLGDNGEAFAAKFALISAIERNV